MILRTQLGYTTLQFNVELYNLILNELRNRNIEHGKPVVQSMPNLETNWIHPIFKEPK
jgi:hypothetical protein